MGKCVTQLGIKLFYVGECGAQRLKRAIVNLPAKRCVILILFYKTYIQQPTDNQVDLICFYLNKQRSNIETVVYRTKSKVNIVYFLAMRETKVEFSQKHVFGIFET